MFSPYLTMALARAKIDDLRRAAPHAAPSSASSARWERQERDASIRPTRRRRRTIYESSLYEADQLGNRPPRHRRRSGLLLEASGELAVPGSLFRCAGFSTLRLAEPALADGDAERAARLLDEALALSPGGDRWGVARCLELDQAVAKGSLSPARQG